MQLMHPLTGQHLPSEHPLFGQGGPDGDGETTC